jgi:hypothetical protein
MRWLNGLVAADDVPEGERAAPGSFRGCHVETPATRSELSDPSEPISYDALPRRDRVHSHSSLAQ